jgi:hypothetical protein
MKQFQKIAIGLLGLTHPEMFISRLKFAPAPARTGEPAATLADEGTLEELPRSAKLRYGCEDG